MNSRDNQTKFDSIFQNIQLCSEYRYCFKNYLEKTFESLLKREDHDLMKVSESIFNAYLDLPLLVSNKIFKVFDLDNDGYLNFKEFSRGMNDLYFGSFYRLRDVLFRILNFTDNLIYKEDVKLVLLYLNSSEAFVKDIDLYIKEFFVEKEQIGYEDYILISENKSVNLIILIIMYLYRKQPFTEDSLKYFDEVYKKREPKSSESKFSQKGNEIKEMIIKPNSEIMRIMKYYFKTSENAKRKKSKKNVLKYDEKEMDTDDHEKEMGQEEIMEMKHLETQQEVEMESKIFETEDEEEVNNVFSKFSQESSASSVSDSQTQINSKLTCHHKHTPVESEFVTPKFEMEIYVLIPKENKLSKQKLVVIDKELFLLNSPFNSNTYTLDCLHPLTGLFATSCNETTFMNILFFPIVLLNSYGNTKANIKNVFFFRKKKDADACMDLINKSLNIREVKDEFEIMKTIGRGEFGKVKLGVNKKTNHKVAIKIIKKKKIKEDDLKIVKNEIDVMKFLKTAPHENIIKPIDIFEDKNNIYLVIEHVNGGSLNEFIVKNEEIMNEDISRNLCKQIARGLNHLHKHGIIHRDIKPENMLLHNSHNRDKPVLKIIDFGLSKVISCKEKSKEGFGSLLFASPEVLKRKDYCKKVDIWSFGILIFYFNSSLFPFDGDNI